MNQTSHLLFAACSPGLEPLLQRELGSLGFPSELREGGVELRASSDGLFRLALSSALAESLRLRLKSFVARDFDTLQAGIAKLPWRAYLAAGERVELRVVCHRSKLWHSGAVAERVAEVLRDRVGLVVDEAGEEAEEPANEPVTVHLRITGDAVQPSVDATGRLHRRGYRTHVEKASLRETLAAALVQLACEQRPSLRPHALWDPFCGAGTVALEASRHFRQVAPGLLRSFPFERWPTHDAAAFEQLKLSLADSTAVAVPRPAEGVTVYASDISERALDATRHNLARSGARLEVLFGDFARVAEQIPPGTWIITNPPYGERLEAGGAIPRFVQLLEERPDLRPALLLVGGAAQRQLPARFSTLLTTKNGGLDVAVRALG